MSIEFREVWYASDKRARSASKFFVYDDVGALTVRSDGMEFRGEKCHVAFSQVGRVERARQAWNWIAYLVTNVAMSPLYALSYLAARHFHIAGEYVVLVALTLNVTGFVIGRAVTWVAVTGRGRAGEPMRAWFSAGARQGWAGIFGLTAQLYEETLRQLHSGAHGPPDAPTAADGGRAC